MFFQSKVIPRHGAFILWHMAEMREASRVFRALRVLERPLGLLGTLLTVMLVVGVIGTAVAWKIQGLRYVPILIARWRPGMPRETMAITKPIPYEEVREGMVVALMPPYPWKPKDGNPVVHRAFQITTSDYGNLLTLETNGDHNAACRPLEDQPQFGSGHLCRSCHQHAHSWHHRHSRQPHRSLRSRGAAPRAVPGPVRSQTVVFRSPAPERCLGPGLAQAPDRGVWCGIDGRRDARHRPNPRPHSCSPFGDCTSADVSPLPLLEPQSLRDQLLLVAADANNVCRHNLRVPTAPALWHARCCS